MAILFDFYHSPSTEENGEETKEKFHARVVGGQTFDLDDIVEHIHQRSTLSPGDIKAVLCELGTEFKHIFSNGNQLSLPDIGNFYMTLQAPKDADPKNTHAQNIQVKRIEFRADRKLVEAVRNKAVFERSREKKHSAHISIQEIDAYLVDYFEEHSFITRKGFEELCHLTRSTASRHLTRLVHEGRLINTNTPRNPAFEPAKGYYNRK